MKSQITFEGIDGHFKLSDKALVVTLYHWASPDTDNYKHPLKLSDLNNNSFLYVCDDAYVWATEHMLDACTLYEIDCVIRKPLCLMEQFSTYEQTFQNPSAEFSLFLEGNFDALIITPHSYSRGERQCLIRYPKDQVLAIREVEKPTKADVRQAQKNSAKLWSEILLKR